MSEATKTKTTAKFDDKRMEAAMGRLLQSGVVLASIVVLAGGLIYVSAHAHSMVNYRTFVSKPLQIQHPLDLMHRVLAGEAAAIIQLGVLLLVATPIARVAFAVIGFAIERDRLYVGISLFVLAVLIFSLLHAA